MEIWDRPAPLGRRAVLAGAGALAGAAASVRSARADAHDAAPFDVAPTTSPIETTIASPPLSGRVYRFNSGYDFLPLTTFELGREYGGFGVFAPFGTSYLAVFRDIAPGALWRDVEFYVRNARPVAQTAFAILARADVGAVFTIGTVAIAPNTSLTATLLTLPSSVWGPYPQGVKAGVMIIPHKDESVQINGARFGFSNGGGETSVLANPTRVFDSRETGGKFAANEERTIVLPKARAWPGTIGVILNVQVLGASAAGTLSVFSPAVADPSPSLSFTPNPAAGQLTVAINAARQIALRPTKAAHVVIDLVGTIG